MVFETVVVTCKCNIGSHFATLDDLFIKLKVTSLHGYSYKINDELVNESKRVPWRSVFY